MFKGIQKVSLIDYPQHIVTTLFTCKCNFKCSFCYNKPLIDPKEYSKLPNIPEGDIKNFLLDKRSKIEGVCITGGEPTLQEKKLIPFLEWLKNNNFLVKLDTNGYKPETLQMYIKHGLLDFVAMDIKNTFEKYAETVGIKNFQLYKIISSINLIKESGIKHQFRTTLFSSSIDKNKIIQQVGEPVVFQEFVLPKKIEKNPSFSYSYNKNP